jgi:propanediol dehydratase small subunit
LDEVTVAATVAGEITLDDLQIDKAALQAQAEIARQAGYAQLAQNLARAAELTVVPRAEIIDMYQQLRPGRSSHAELIALATRLEDVYVAPICGAFVREAAQVYLERNMLRRPPAF